MHQARTRTGMQPQLPLYPALTLRELESHLWEAANILRGSPADRSDWKSYILPMLFFKCIVDAASLFRKGRAQNFLDPEHADTILRWVQEFAAVADSAAVEDRAAVVTVEEIAAEDWTLNISRYVLPPIGADIPPLDEAIANFKTALARCRDAEEELRRVMVDGGWLGDNSL
ncbi:N-6 DNA methylase [bacterium]|nr:N-6 DNA methylase [bacterium]